MGEGEGKWFKVKEPALQKKKKKKKSLFPAIGIFHPSEHIIPQ
jgi:hypothetical protein